MLARQASLALRRVERSVRTLVIGWAQKLGGRAPVVAEDRVTFLFFNGHPGLFCRHIFLQQACWIHCQIQIAHGSVELTMPPLKASPVYEVRRVVTYQFAHRLTRHLHVKVDVAENLVLLAFSFHLFCFCLLFLLLTCGFGALDPGRRQPLLATNHRNAVSVRMSRIFSSCAGIFLDLAQEAHIDVSPFILFQIRIALATLSAGRFLESLLSSLDHWGVAFELVTISMLREFAAIFGSSFLILEREGVDVFVATR